MVAYIRDRRTFAVKHYASVWDWDLALASTEAETSRLMVQGGNTSVSPGDFLFYGDYQGIIQEVDVGEESLDITCQPMDSLFARELLLDCTQAEGTIEEKIQSWVQQAFVDQEDVLYQLPFLQVIPQTATQGDTLPDVEEDGIWSIEGYLSKVRQLHQIYTAYSVNGNQLVMRIFHRQPARHQVFLSLSGVQTLEESFAQETIGKITTKAEDTGQVQDWYLLTDGSITNTYTPNDRVEGSWEVLTISKEEEVADKVAEEFAGNTASHLIEFATDKRYELGDQVVIRTKKGLVVASSISSVRREKGRDQTVYKSGELRLMLDEKLNKKLGGK